ncbi:MFS transporter [Emticicia sp. W12TSBA100-4]|uniref:MFS transporter n=1 Tax=Emticicia sp. W12TSBA100-4 TaxID=3160965 RepID=UPI00330584C9
MSKNYKWWVVFMLWFVCFFNYADRQAIFSVFPLLKQEMGLSDVQLGIVGAAFMWVYAGFGAIAGIVGDRFQRKTLIIGGLIFWSLVTIGTALSTDYIHLVICRALEGFGEAFYFPASMSLLSDYHSKETRSKAMSFHQSSVYAGTIAGGTVAGFMGQYYGWHTSFYLFGGLGVLLGVILLGFLKEPVRGQAEVHEEIEDGSHVLLDLKQGNIFDSIKQVFKQPMVWILVAVFVGANFVASIFLTWMPSFLYNKFNMSLSMAGLNATFYLQMASVLGVISGGFLADKLVKTYRGGRMMAQSIGLIIGVPFIFLAGWTLSIPILILALIGFGYFKGLYDANIWASLHDVVKPKNRATAVGFMNSIGWFGGGIAPIAIAYASTKYGMSASISATSALYLVFGLLLIFGIRKFMRNQKS